MMLNRAICRLSPQMTNVVIRRSLGQFGMPQNRISLTEKAGLFVVSSVLIAGPMLYIMASLKRYQGKV